jgi:biopolymer transport protein ExbB/TolQ
MFGTAAMLRSGLHSVPGCSYGDCAGGVAETFVPFALSLPVAIFASAGFHYFRQQIEDFDLEMHTWILNLLDHLGRRHPGRE